MLHASVRITSIIPPSMPDKVQLYLRPCPSPSLCCNCLLYDNLIVWCFNPCYMGSEIELWCLSYLYLSFLLSMFFAIFFYHKTATLHCIVLCSVVLFVATCGAAFWDGFGRFECGHVVWVVWWTLTKNGLDLIWHDIFHFFLSIFLVKYEINQL